jgi:hypothetical protein
MRTSIFAILVAIGTTAAMPANACCVQQSQTQEGAAKAVTTGSTAGTPKAAPSTTDGKVAAKDKAITNETVGTGPG